jgi:Skp family chaperone for outer membrane proteins
VTELQGIQTRIQSIAAEIQKMTGNTAVPVDQKALAAKQDEGQRLQREGEFKKKEYDAAVERRSNELLGPISADISRAIQDFAKARGYTVILDIDRLGQAGAILSLDPSANVTKEFITFYNMRPAAAATATATKP